MGVFEAGISRKGEMEKLERMIVPDIGVLTHLGPAHNQGFENPHEKLLEKLKLFKNSRVVLHRYNTDVTANINTYSETFDFNNPKATLNITVTHLENEFCSLNAWYKNEAYRIKIPFTDEASIENACLTWLISLYLEQFDAEKFEKLHAVSMRMELKKGLRSCLLINDSYSNDLHALSSALAFLSQQAIHEHKTLILSDIEESGLSNENLYIGIPQMLKDKGIDKLIGIGKEIAFLETHLEGIESHFFESTETFLKSPLIESFEHESILIKGARKYRFERITKRLSQETHGTTLEIDLSAVLKNLNIIKSKLPKDIKIMGMVKAFAYGSGTYEVAKTIQKKVDYLAVAYTDEGVALRDNGINTPIMVMNVEEETYPQLIENNLEPVIFSTKQLLEFNNFINTQTKNKVKIHIELDTGMHRLGLMSSEVDDLIEKLNFCQNVEVASIFSHLSASDEKQHDEFTKKQFESFKILANKIENSIGYSPLKHISNTSAILRFKQEGLNMVRLGIGLYGIDPTGSFNELLEPVFTLKTNISQIKHIDSNDSVGYARKAISENERRIAILALGYADGLNRILSNEKGQFLINGQLAPIIGNVCMDMCMVDVTQIDCSEGDEAVLFGKDKSIVELSEQMGTIPYEVLTAISQRVKRVYVSE
jgi:alanine racemase